MTTWLKSRRDAPPGFFACEAAGLGWLRVPGGPRVVRVLGVRDTALELERLVPSRPTARAADDLGRSLAVLHRAGAPAFGAPPDGWTGDGFFGPLSEPLPLRAGRYERWGEFHAACRLEPLADALRRRGRLDDDVAGALERLSRRLRDGALDDGSPPARVHGDLWSGNVVWTQDGAVLVDPAAHGGHPLTDVAMLDLFGLPHLDRVTAAYREATGLVVDRGLLALHQVYPVGMHVVLFGEVWAGRLAATLRASA
ncbi:fructosamine kinase family protein [Cellulomonas carbonis]|uniref:Fructosamine kinase n=1 Tax=Cellulomonas carbonis T26 TaxID=947969 RepID=A0A0A0BSQ4_9CELL|nr:fructosamine kinase family protein [Cellulomonas carbonis]KGM10986.1 fructosamine kinase [Cellulomonas carbonis T26]GGB95994.1 fructosamine kinase [Cellulomonas carbonis]